MDSPERVAVVRPRAELREWLAECGHVRTLVLAGPADAERRLQGSGTLGSAAKAP